jgi:hypothetical protein
MRRAWKVEEDRSDDDSFKIRRGISFQNGDASRFCGTRRQGLRRSQTGRMMVMCPPCSGRGKKKGSGRRPKADVHYEEKLGCSNSRSCLCILLLDQATICAFALAVDARRERHSLVEVSYGAELIGPLASLGDSLSRLPGATWTFWGVVCHVFPIFFFFFRSPTSVDVGTWTRAG